jgi:diguanylate cyclase (GGDEF)-like protein
MALIGPGVLCVFGFAFLWAWSIEKTRRYLLLLAGAPGLFALGVATQVFHWPPDINGNALLSGFLYTSAVLVAAEGILRRSGKRFGLAIDLLVLALLMGALCYFAYVNPNTLVRVYIQNFGYGLIFLVSALRLLPFVRGKPADRVLFWVLLIFAIQFFPRTLVTIGFHAPTSTPAFAASLFWAALQLSLAILGTGLATTLLAAAFSDLIEDLRHERDIDGLTGVLNRRGFENRAAMIIAQAGREPCSLVACDLDHFKRINDHYGHAAGDRVLKAFGRLLRLSCRASDLVGRIGGEEFAILLRGAADDEAFEFAERLRARLSEVEFEFLPSASPVTTSVGIAELRPGETINQLLARADQQLYRAKAAGRNVTVAADDRASLPLFAPDRVYRRF